MKSNVVQHQTDIRADISLIDEIIKLNQEGLTFYNQAMTYVEDYNLKRIFSTKANIHQRMLTRFEQLRPLSSEPLHGLSHTIPVTYTQATKLLHQCHISQAMAALVVIEQQVLTQMKQAVRQAHQPQLANQLAEGAAWLQISCDGMNSLNPG